MFGIIGFILLFLLLIVLLALALVGNIVRFIFGLGRRSPKPSNGQANQTNSHSGSFTTTSTRTDKKKIFGDDEGEYVDFEEVS